ncbi:MAG: DUF3473 domain-containing protein [Desulfobacter sp.]|nr:MAG: DUF3473 domain-containing protein [Desulfobacter sp.]
MSQKHTILLTFDVEDWFQVENFKDYIEFSTWNNFELRVERNTHRILDFLDSFVFEPKATFFILGWIAKRCPDLVREIHSRGHEVASHGFDHHLCTNLRSNQLVLDLVDSRKLLEDISGRQVTGYRAPSFAVSHKTLAAIQKAGYLYDSSYNSFSAHGRYGVLDLPNENRINGFYKLSNELYEIPISNLRVGDKIFPLGGGGYFRLFPLSLFKFGMHQVFKQQDVFLFYAHPWEFDPGQPRVRQASNWFKFRHYINLNKTENKLKTLIGNFSDFRFITCSDYITDSVSKG